MINLRPNSGIKEKRDQHDIVPTIEQFTDLTMKEPILGKKFNQKQKRC